MNTGRPGPLREHSTRPMRLHPMAILRSLAAFAVVLACSPSAFPQAKQPKGPVPPDGATVDRDVAYGPHERNKLDVFTPKGDGPFPVVVLVHGGGWQGGNKDNPGAVQF